MMDGQTPDDPIVAEASPGNDVLMTIGDMCAAFEVTPRTLRFYESKDLLAPKRIGQRRLYSRRDRARLTLTLRGKRFGFSLEELRALLDLYDHDDGQAEQLAVSQALAQEKLEEMERRRAELDAAITDLRDRIRWADATLGALRDRMAAE